ncbi:acyl-CoA thioesterase [Amycolatopsis pithecellobii]|uniref:Acyl-CoA thioesterase n=1 Tax=Amycolatopsis pithecellobii TaxID=664692 RepID=A0A6N7Z5F2_9PSEU|nr:thioesterase family protein [Amycolatopsis pithecellobii]MTD56849.1 acyl-CoA thioesterase [Amycolatopsis pithecellobii]
MYVAMVRPRWSDMDSFGHVNHARMVTLLEEARIPLVFTDAVKAGLPGFAAGMVVVKLSVHYRAPVVVNSTDLRVEISLRDLKFASITLDYTVYSGSSTEDTIAAVADTVLAPYDVSTGRPRRFTDEEREFLKDRLADD